MKKIIALSFNDLRNIFREQMLLFMFFVAPVMMFLLARFALPEAGVLYPVITAYYPLLLLLLTLQISTGVGFVLASIILDERDEGVLEGIRIMPLAANAFIFYRIAFSMVITFLVALIMVTATGLIKVSLFSALGVSFLFSLVAPLVLLALPSFSKNKVEGLAFFKAFNLLLLLPASSFFITSKLSYLFGIVPLYWTFHYFDAVNNGGNYMLMFGISVVVHLVWLLALIQLFKQKVFLR